MFKAVAQMTDGDRYWMVVICSHCTAMDAERAGLRFVAHYDVESSPVKCLWFQVLPE